MQFSNQYTLFIPWKCSQETSFLVKTCEQIFENDTDISTEDSIIGDQQTQGSG
jgi:hypothetical protein